LATRGLLSVTDNASTPDVPSGPAETFFATAAALRSVTPACFNAAAISLGLVAIALAVSPITLDPVLEVGTCVSSTSLVDAVYVGAWRRLRYAVPAVQASRISAITRQCWPTMRRRASFSSTDTPGLGVRSACGPTPSGP